ncbi:MAG: LysM peptidoglycan-binding domain-containing protein [Deltaproteobacteria bacterium]|nr:LysM peptidoglycan-binding domain-containing protein [Deltaproteobacteria bacterium]MBW2139350.1 LysM peptidoglycan-binding domain-containing protein [Deltaproteobacteria bacterium]
MNGRPHCFSPKIGEIPILRGMGVLAVSFVLLVFAACGERPSSGEMEEIRSSVKRLDNKLTLMERNYQRRLTELEKSFSQVKDSLSVREKREAALQERLKKLGEQVYTMQKALAQEKATQVAKPAAPQKTETGQTGDYYVVKLGDTLYRIARNHDLSVEELMDMNNLSKDQHIYPGQRLLIRRGR